MCVLGSAFISLDHVKPAGVNRTLQATEKYNKEKDSDDAHSVLVMTASRETRACLFVCMRADTEKAPQQG